MKLLSFVTLATAVSAVKIPNALLPRAAECGGTNCWRAVNKDGQIASRLAECKSFITSQVITKYVVATKTESYTSVITSVSTVPAQLLGKRQEALSAGIPAWAANCRVDGGLKGDDALRFSSACVCAYIQASSSSPSMSTVSATSTIYLTTESSSTTTTTTTTTSGCPASPAPTAVRIKVIDVQKKTAAGSEFSDATGAGAIGLIGSYVTIDSDTTYGVRFGLTQAQCGAAIFFSNVGLATGSQPLYLDRSAKAVKLTFGTTIPTSGNEKLLRAVTVDASITGTQPAVWSYDPATTRVTPKNAENEIQLLFYPGDATVTPAWKKGKLIGTTDPAASANIPVTVFKLILKLELAQ
ncbi:hypothetical protein TWF481_001811 [Arthrobotrys musiformis]|uniref:Uncharacterized protein n=1 Tax=Arthrobotrys musiformis TaxID=47236 RepID=A0AAV9VUB9_9PEZI